MLFGCVRGGHNFKTYTPRIEINKNKIAQKLSEGDDVDENSLLGALGQV